jgi:hypothetical protein
MCEFFGGGFGAVGFPQDEDECDRETLRYNEGPTLVPEAPMFTDESGVHVLVDDSEFDGPESVDLAEISDEELVIVASIPPDSEWAGFSAEMQALLAEVLDEQG